MKTLNKTLTVSLFTTLLLTGCMPDSLTKFKKDPPKKAEVSTADAPTTTVTDTSGNTINVSLLVDPTFFRFDDDVNNKIASTVLAKIGTRVSLLAEVDGSVADAGKAPSVRKGCSISPALPAGLTLDNTLTTKGCSITGTPQIISTNALTPGAPINYTVTMHYLSNAGTQKSITASIAIGVYSSPEPFDYLQNERLLLKVAPIGGTLTATTNSDVDATYLRSGFITTSSGVIGVVKYIDADNNKLGIIKTIPIRVNNFALLGLPADEYPGLLTPRFISAAGGKSAKIIRAVAATSTIYVEMLSSRYFTAGDVLDDTKAFVSSTGATVANVDLTTGIKKASNGLIDIDNNVQYFLTAMSGSQVSRVYEVAKTFGTDVPRLTMTTEDPSIMSPVNAVKYTVAPALPNGLAINEDTGEITGSFADIQDPSFFTIKATNPLGSTTTEIGLSSIKAPLDLSYTNRQLVAVKSTVKFIESEAIMQPIVAPSTTSIVGQILRKYDRGSGSDENRYKLAIETTNGYFPAGVSLDSGNYFYSEKSFIPSSAVTPTAATPSTTPINVNYNLAITVGTAAPFAIGGYVSTPQGALGRVVAIEGTTLFVQVLTPGTTPAFVPFQERSAGVANSIDNAITYVAPETTITQIEAKALTVTMSSLNGSPDFSNGQDITSGAKLGAYISSSNQTDPMTPVDPTIINIDKITKRSDVVPYLKAGQTIYDNENETGPNNAVITNVAHQNVLITETSKYVEYRANLSEGNSLTYNVSPALPAGLSLNKATGLISGTPTVRTPLKNFIVTATNLIGKSSYLLQLEVRDYFKVDDASGATTFQLHKYGKNMHSRECKINASDILENQGLLDVRCFLDAEEEELHNTALKFASSAGAGVCEFIQVEPYNFYQWSPVKTPASTRIVTTTGCATSSNIPAPDQPYWISTTPTTDNICLSNYTAAGGPNCDEGNFLSVVYSGSDADNNGTCETIIVSESKVINCAGKASACLNGPVTDILTPQQIEQGYRSLIYSTSNGAVIKTDLKSPDSKLNYSNMRVANSTIANNCSMTNSDADIWESLARANANTSSPMGRSQPFYTFNCLDGAKDIKARIRLVVRDWNKTFKINSFIDFDLPGALPGGSAIMNNSDVVFNKSNNDYADWDDTYNGAGASYAGTCSAVSFAHCDNPAYRNSADCATAGATWVNPTGVRYQYPESSL